ncbi:MAG: hypothetical protein V4735_07110 [Pseudomonadota bacterium]
MANDKTNPDKCIKDNANTATDMNPGDTSYIWDRKNPKLKAGWGELGDKSIVLEGPEKITVQAGDRVLVSEDSGMRRIDNPELSSTISQAVDLAWRCGNLDPAAKVINDLPKPAASETRKR